MDTQPPQNPAGEFVPATGFDAHRCAEFIATVSQAPAALRAAIDGLNDHQLDTLYRNWTVRQIAHHLVDSHLHNYLRFKWALTEDLPTIKPWDEAQWAALEDSRTADVQPGLALMAALQIRWSQLMQSMTPDQFQRAFHHPQSRQNVPLFDALCYYAWHARHHTAQILWLRQHHGW